MSDLNKRIAEWRASLAAQFDQIAADELEDHLRMHIESLASTGLAEDERLLLAAHRLGQPESLANEFNKEPSLAVWQTRILWLLVGMIPLLFLQSSIRDIGQQIGKFLLYSGSSYWSAATPAIAAHLASLGVVVGAYAWLRKTMQIADGSPLQVLRTLFTPRTSLIVAVMILIGLEPYMMASVAGNSDWYNLRGVVIEAHVTSDSNLLHQIYAGLQIVNFLAIALAIAGLFLSLQMQSQSEALTN
jgi:hypothetical protein